MTLGEELDRQLLALKVVLEGLDDGETARLLERLKSAERIFVVGLGRSGAVLRAFAARLARLGRPVHDLLDAHAPAVSEGDLLLVGSGSGMTAPVLAAAERALEAGARLTLLTANAISPLGRLAEERVLIPPAALTLAGGSGEGAITSVQVLFEQAMLLLLDQLAGRLGAGPEGEEPSGSDVGKP